MIENYPSNSKKAKSNERPTVQKMVTRPTIVRKRPLSSRIRENLTSGVGVDGIMFYVMSEVIVPALKDLLFDSFTEGLNKALFDGSRGASSRHRSTGRSGHTSYSVISSSRAGRREEPSGGLSKAARSRHDFSEIVITERGEAEMILDSLLEIIKEYDVVTVAEFYGLVGVKSSFADQKWGWDSLASSGVSRVPGGYVIRLPRPIALD